MSSSTPHSHILDPGFELTLRPMKYPQYFEMFKNGIKNTWTVEEINFQIDISDLHSKMNDAERHLIYRLVAFFATGDTIVANNLVLNLYQHINAPEARMYLSRQLYEEALHIQFYLTLLDNYIPDINERQKAFAAIENIPSIKKKGDFCFKWIDSVQNLHRLESKADRKQFLLNLICFAACIEGLFFYGAFSYVYYLRDKGLLPGLASGTNWVFRDESCHMEFAFDVVKTVREQEPDLFDAELEAQVYEMLEEAIQCETAFADDVLGLGVMGFTPKMMRQYLEYCADDRFRRLGMAPKYNVSNPLPWMELQDVQELTNFFERRVTAYQVGTQGEVAFDMDF
ncbi:ribonucleotide-diphosphate reductase subunit beta [Frateuria aurantia]|uniref:Ribonucleoside-diphosphate reductase subunit beta n=1 Tax=Frateuria aurantia (strain ATCC 33424 / DSM 6220 / KCTC 2777 / LMG 1558 / NBRC 3245 / NCIMB 13370) TaxID=767434 RepID=H8L0K5_FRAAD|nr:ribonucleotide-diphosphate reductase subunit beta [Frateuria aurantia]AFC84631.1 ribonucleotide reductase, beta subunit [Frateuria aurantia DSM 6220]